MSHALQLRSQHGCELGSPPKSLTWVRNPSCSCFVFARDLATAAYSTRYVLATTLQPNTSAVTSGLSLGNWASDPGALSGPPTRVEIERRVSFGFS